jgi:hypothetical protein
MSISYKPEDVLNPNYMGKKKKKENEVQAYAPNAPSLYGDANPLVSGTSNPYKPQTASPIRSSATDVVSSWGDKGKMTDEAVNSFTDKVQSLYDYEAQQRAAADANFQKSMRYLPEMYKSAGLYGSGQSESMLLDMANKQRNTQNAISADTNAQLNTLRDQYNAEVANLDAEAKAQVDEVANIMSNIDWASYTPERYKTFIEYIKSADYDDSTIDLAIKQVEALNPEVGKVISALKTGAGTEGGQSFTGQYALSPEELQQAKIIAEPAKITNNAKYVRNNRDFTINYNGKEFKLEGGASVDADMQTRLDSIAKQAGVSTVAGRVLFVDGEFYVYSGQANKGWRKATNIGFEWQDLLSPVLPLGVWQNDSNLYSGYKKRNDVNKLKEVIKK